MRCDLRLVPATAERVRVNAAAGREAAAVVGLTDATTPARRLASIGCSWLVRVGGAALLPQSPGDWTQAAPAALEAELRSLAPGFSMLGVVLPRQRERHHMMVFGRSLGTLVVAKLDADHRAIAHESHVLELLAERPIPSLLTPRVLATGGLDLGEVEAHAMITAVVAHRSSPAFGEMLPWLERELAERLGSLSRGNGVPDDWVPAHGDLAPWNLRRTPFGLALFDWEATGHAPAGFDQAYYQACNAALGRMPWPDVDGAVAEHLRRLIDTRATSDLGPVDRAIRSRLGESTPTSPAEVSEHATVAQ